MDRHRTESSIVMQLLGGSLVAPLQGEISDTAMIQIQSDILKRISSAGVKGLILDVSGIATIDSFLAQSLIETEKMATLLGTTTVLVGLRADIVATLIHLKIDLHGVKTALNLDMAQEILKPFTETKTASEADEGAMFKAFEKEDHDVDHFAEEL